MEAFAQYVHEDRQVGLDSVVLGQSCIVCFQIDLPSLMYEQSTLHVWSWLQDKTHGSKVSLATLLGLL